MNQIKSMYDDHTLPEIVEIGFYTTNHFLGYKVKYSNGVVFEH